MQRDYFLNQFGSQRPKSVFDNGFQQRFFAEDPIFFSFSIFFEADCPLLNPASNLQRESAERYFLNQDDDEKAGYVVELRERLNALVTDHQYFLKKVVGLNTFYDKTVVDGSTIELEIETMESLDMRVTKIKELYNRITYDYRNKKEILPDNLTWINMKITVADGRKIAKWINGGFVDITPSLDTLCFTLKKTRFDFSKGHAYLGEVSNEEYAIGSNDLSFKGGRGFIEESRIGLKDLLTNEKTSINSINTNTRDFNGDEVELITPSPEKVVEKKSLKDQLNEQVQRAKTLAESKLDGVKTKFGEVVTKDNALNQLNKLGSQLARATQRTVVGAAEDAILGAKNDLGLTNVNSTINGANILDVLKNAILDGGLTFENNKDLERKILNGDSITKEEKDNLFVEIIKKSDRL